MESKRDPSPVDHYHVLDQKHSDLLSSRVIEKHSLFTDSQLTQKKSQN